MAAIMSGFESDSGMCRNRIIGFDNSVGNNNCWLNAVIRVLAHMIENTQKRYQNESRSARTLIEKFLLYIKDNVIANTGRKHYLCFDENNISIGPNIHSLKWTVSSLTNTPTFNTAIQQDAAEAIEKLLDVVPLFQFCMYRYFFQQTCSQCPHTSDHRDTLDRILRVHIPENTDMEFDMERAIMDTLMGRQDSQIQCPECGHQTVSTKMTLLTVPDFLIVQVCR